MWWTRSLSLLLILMLPASGHAFCFEQAAAEYNLAPSLLYSIGKWESKLNPTAVNWNTNGSYDFGVMQINSAWEPTLRKHGIKWQSLADPCTNVRVGAWILSQCLNKYGNTWQGVGCYNSQTPSKRNAYAQHIYQTLIKLDVKPQQKVASIKPPAITDEIKALDPNDEPKKWGPIVGLETYQ